MIARGASANGRLDGRAEIASEKVEFAPPRVGPAACGSGERLDDHAVGDDPRSQKHSLAILVVLDDDRRRAGPQHARRPTSDTARKRHRARKPHRHLGEELKSQAESGKRCASRQPSGCRGEGEAVLDVEHERVDAAPVQRQPEREPEAPEASVAVRGTARIRREDLHLVTGREARSNDSAEATRRVSAGRRHGADDEHLHRAPAPTRSPSDCSMASRTRSQV